MKHNLKTIFILITFFLLAQLLGLAILAQYIDIKTTAITKQTVVIEQSYNITGIQPPEVRDDSYSFIFIALAVLLGTAIVLLIIRFQQRKLWKLWFYLSVIITLMMAFSPFMEKILRYINSADYTTYITLLLVAVLGYFKVFKPNLYVHNITELFIYGGLAAILVPVFNIISIVILLLLISAYDAYAVWKSKHMVKMAEFQTENNLFAGLMIPKKAALPGEKSLLIEEKKTAQKSKQIVTTSQQQQQTEEQKAAILGGGDIAFPLLFTGTIFKYAGTLLDPLIIIATTTITLFLLFTLGEKNRYYPAMPFLTTGCFVGWGITLLLHLI